MDNLINIYDYECESETPYYIDSDRDKYFSAYVYESGEPVCIARICKWNNHVTPYENLDNGVLYDSIPYLCDVATGFRYWIY